MRLAMPLNGKMAFRSFHNRDFMSRLSDQAIDPCFYLDPAVLSEDLPASRYAPFHMDRYRDLYSNNKLLNRAATLRRFTVRTESTNVRFKDSMWNFLSADPGGDRKNLFRPLAYIFLMDLLRQFKSVGALAVWLEGRVKTDFHLASLKEQGIDGVLTPGVGNFGFLFEGRFALEAQQLDIPVFSAVTNYDNLVNRGGRGFMPDRLLVWSERMADEAINLAGAPASRIEITGPVQFDRYFQNPPISRDEFLTSKGLDPAKKTIFYAGTGWAPMYYDMLGVFRDRLMSDGELKEFNLVIRPVPDRKLTSWYGLTALKDILGLIPGVYVSDPFAQSGDSFGGLISGDEDAFHDELHCLFKYSDVLINHYSTVSLESALNDLPTIHIGFDMFSYGLWCKSWYRYAESLTHNRRKLRLAAARYPRSVDELIKDIDAYLDDPALDRDNRLEYAASECGLLDGRAGRRTAEAIARN